MQALRLNHHEMVLKLDASLEQAVESVLQQERERAIEIEKSQRIIKEVILGVEAAMEMVAVEVRNHVEEGSRRGKARFVQIYPDIVRECESALQEYAAIPDLKAIESIVTLKVPLLTNIAAPIINLKRDQSTQVHF